MPFQFPNPFLRLEVPKAQELDRRPPVYWPVAHLARSDMTKPETIRPDLESGEVELTFNGSFGPDEIGWLDSMYFTPQVSSLQPLLVGRRGDFTWQLYV